MTGNDDDAAGPRGTPPGRLRAVRGPLASDPGRPAVQLHREWKGLTVADLYRDEVAGQLPGQVASALAHLQRGDLRAADRTLPEAAVPVLPGPGHRRHHHRLLVALVAIAGLAAATALALWLCA